MNEAKHTKELLAAIVRSDNAQSRCANGDLLISAISDLERQLSDERRNYNMCREEFEHQLSEAQASFEASQSRAADTIEKLEQQNAELRVRLSGLIDAVDNCRLDSPPIDTDRYERLMCEREVALKLFASKANSGAEGV